MSETLRDELAELVRQLGAHVAWQRELGALGFEASPRIPSPVQVATPVTTPRAETSAMLAANSTDAPSGDPASASDAPPIKFEMPDFLRKRAGLVPDRSAAPVAPIRPAAAVPEAPIAPPAEPEPRAAEPPPVVRPLFGDDPPAPEAFAVRGPALEGEARITALRVINDAVTGCTRCRLHQERTQTVFSRGNPFARVAFVGEGPGRDEDLSGKPFVGAAGKLLDKIIAAMGFGEDDVYVCNVVKCRPPGNRVPEPDEMATCGGFLVSQLGLVRPEIIVALGKTSAGFLLSSTSSMSKMRGRWHQWEGIPVLATWHPAYLLRQPEAKRETWDDMKLVLQRLGLPLPPRA